MKKALLGLIGFVILLAAVIIIRASMYTPIERQHAKAGSPIAVDSARVAQHLSEAVQFKTISPQPPLPIDQAEFDGFIAWAAETYPEVHANLSLTRLGTYSLLFKWTGSDPSLKPVLLTGHYDVVPVNLGTEEQWKHAPFGGEIIDGVVWGRGSLDDKSAVITILEAATALLAEGFEPARTIYLSFGHDEEIGGDEGAAAVTAHLKAKGVQLAWSLDEGSFLLQGFYPGIDVPVASINIAEKGYLTLDLIAKGTGGHSSMPPAQTAVGTLAVAIVKLQNAPVPGGLGGPGTATLDVVSRYFPFSQRIIFANQWLLGGVLESTLSREQVPNAMMRTTTAPTMLSASVKENVLPIEAIATVNFRLHPRDSVEDIIAFVEKTIDDERIEIRPVREGNPASPISSATSEGYKVIEQTVGHIYGDAITTPGMTVAATDTKHYGTVADDAYRFNPIVVTPTDITGFHGTNESISVENLEHATAYYAELMRLGAGAQQ